MSTDDTEPTASRAAQPGTGGPVTAGDGTAAGAAQPYPSTTNEAEIFRVIWFRWKPIDTCEWIELK